MEKSLQVVLSRVRANHCGLDWKPGSFTGCTQSITIEIESHSPFWRQSVFASAHINWTMSSWFWDDSGGLLCSCVQGIWQIWFPWCWASSGLCARLHGGTPARGSCMAGWSSIRSQPHAPGDSACCVSSAMWFVVGACTSQSTAFQEYLSSTEWGWGTCWYAISGETKKDTEKALLLQGSKIRHISYKCNEDVRYTCASTVKKSQFKPTEASQNCLLLINVQRLPVSPMSL